MKRIAIFAHYDKNNKIEDYVIYFLKELKKNADKIIFISDSFIENTELDKIRPFVDYCKAEKHGEYDFGSYKRGIAYAKENSFFSDCDELILTNDSCYAPLFPFEEMFDTMSSKNLDFWGCIANKTPVRGNIEHIQSYFIVFKKTVFLSDCFYEFFESVTSQIDKGDIVSKYECGMTKFFSEHGYKWDVYSKISKRKRDAYLYFYKDMIKKERTPFLKRSIILFNAKMPYWNIKNLINKHTQYDYELINKDYKHNITKITVKLILIIIYKFFIRIPMFKIRFLFK